MDMVEKMLLEKYQKKTDKLYEKFRGQIDNVANVFKKRQGRSMNQFDVYALGKMMENYSSYIRMIPETVSQNFLGRVLPTAMDIIASSYVTSIMPAISSVQPMDELVGVIFFKTNYVDNNQTFDPFGKRNWGVDQFASDFVQDEVLGTLAAGSGSIYLDCTGVLSKNGCRKGSLIVKIMHGTNLLVTGVSDSDGNVYGPNGLTGSYNPDNGNITVELLHEEAVGAQVGDRVLCTYNFDFEANITNIPKSTFRFTDKTVRARIYMLEGQWGLITEYTLQKRFGRAMDVEVANDLRAELNAEVASAAITTIYQNLVGEVTYPKNPAPGTSAYEHRMMFRDCINNSTNQIIANVGKGRVSYIIAGGNLFTILASQPGFKFFETGSEIGPHVAGQLDDITVIRAVSNNLVPADEGIAGYRGANWFESGVVYAPYLPLFITGTVQIGSAFQQAMGAAHAAAIEMVVPAFTTKIRLT
jgi:hypothetical protein